MKQRLLWQYKFLNKLVEKKSKTSWVIFVLEAIEEIKKQCFTVVNEEEGREPSLG